LLVALFMHLIPILLVVIALLIAWRRRGLGGLLFISLAVVSIFFFHTYQHVGSFSLITGPPLLIGLLFVLDWQRSR